MSTCKGAPAPHDHCQHGKLCDWDGDRGSVRLRPAPHELAMPKRPAKRKRR